ncbi:hypothetical protein KC360_g216 [Hortaea werneckii]|nr:hypothetical protein KC344_g220 [Hortaea werneckii]KAI7180420.1 hypothetical protein KC360_g216 [Hortaea werneckii]
MADGLSLTLARKRVLRFAQGMCHRLPVRKGRRRSILEFGGRGKSLYRSKKSYSYARKGAISVTSFTWPYVPPCSRK